MKTALRFVLGTLLVASAAPAARAAFLLTDTDRVVFFGDRTCAPPTFGVQVETFVRVAYPELQACFWHYGEREGRASEAKARFDEQVVPRKPTVIVLCFGLEDPALAAFDEAKLTAFEKEYRELVEKSKGTGARVWIITPPCPDVSRRKPLKKAEYDKTVGKYAETIRKVGAELEVPVLDWYAAAVAYRTAHEKNRRLALMATSGIDPTPLGAAVVTDLILEAWQATPLTVSIEADWTLVGPPSVSSGSMEVTKPNDATMRISLKDVPLPWPVPKRGPVLAEHWPPARFCSYTLKINNVPDEGFVIQEVAAKGRRPRGRKPFLAQMLRDGADIGHIGPIAASKAMSDLAGAIRNKNTADMKAEKTRKSKPPEPEYAEAFETYALAMRQYADAAARVVLRTPRTLSIEIEVKTARAASAEDRAKAKPKRPKSRPAATQPVTTQPAASQPATSSK